MNRHKIPAVPVGDTIGRLQVEDSGAATWIVKREATASKPRHKLGIDHVKEQLRQREWGGEAAVRTYCTAAAANILLKRLGSELGDFLAVAKHADLHAVLEHLHAAVRAGTVGGAVSDVVVTEDEPPLPFVN
ncbi:MAG: hypothetical protein JOZ81_21230 [Chloroflexi bacterium]|nr:hypothetical protein [Chloroflexota bacterium]